jgi:predicted enzyme related to lactoylglutathione lyase
MITGMHALIYSSDAEGVHPSDTGGGHELYLMCDDVAATVEELTAKGVDFTKPVQDHGWGLVTTLRIPGGSELHVYQPKHPTAVAPRPE